MWRNWVIKPLICLSSGCIAQSIVGYICDIGCYSPSDKNARNYLEYRTVTRSKIFAFWTGIVGSLIAMRYYKFEMPKLLKNE
tara:strand:- start:1643 stop:1888 length:246 start_codon:yes stop_codon:yes gene_type:complete